MSVDIAYEYTLKGENKDLAEFVEKTISEDTFNPETLGIEYPEYGDAINPLHAKEILENEIKEIKIYVWVVYRRQFENGCVEEDIYEAMKSQFPHLEVSYKEIESYLFDIIQYQYQN